MGARLLSRFPTDEAKLEAEKHGCGFIMLPHGKFTLVDFEDVERLSEFSWRIHSGGYVTRAVWDGTRNYTIYMHREIANAPDGIDVDHHNRIRVDNRSGNLRVCGRGPNIANSKKTTRSDATSKFKGVSLCWRTGRWRARGTHNYKHVMIGRYDTEQEAAAAYNSWMAERFGEFANPNTL